MAPKGKGSGNHGGAFNFGVDAGEEVVSEHARWDLVQIPVGCILEVCLQGSSIGLGAEDWFALVVDEVSGDHHQGFFIGGAFLGTESVIYEEEIATSLKEGKVHLCPTDPCDHIFVDGLVHATQFRLWRPSTFQATYLVAEGAAALQRAVAREKKTSKTRVSIKATAKAAPVKPAGAKSSKPRKAPQPPGGMEKEDDGGVIPVPSDDEAGTEAHSRGKLRSILKQTRERILGEAGQPSRPGQGEASTGGPEPVSSGPAVPRSTLVAGTSLNPRHQTPLALAPVEDTRSSGTNALMKSLRKQGNAASALLAQAVQSSAHSLKERKKKKRAREKGDVGRAILKLLKGQKEKKGKKHKKSHRRSDRQIKHDPGDPGDDPEEDESSSSSSGESSDPGEKSEAESELSFEAPLRKRAHRDPGSVMSMLVRHAQEQLDRGALLEQEGAQAELTSGVKISTYFALLIRPYHQAGSPLLRELYALGQAIDLLRAGRLPETADALASRFISVHTALTDGNWSTASHLELYPLEPVQSTSTATMLEAQKHKRLVLKSQGYAPSGRWWSPTGRGKGGAQVEKGKKGNTKDRNKGKGKSNTKDGGWSSKSDPNPWKENKDEAPKK